MMEDAGSNDLIELWRAFASTWKKWYRKAEENISPLGVSIPEYRMLTYLQENGPTPMARLAESVDVSQGWITSMVDRLEKMDMVRRTRNDEDRRIIRIEVLESGLETIHSVKELHLEFVKRTIGKFTRDEQEQFYTLLGKLSGNLSE